MAQSIQIILASSFLFAFFYSCQAVPIVPTTSGKLRGTTVFNTTTNVYLGIPFALPPVDQLRFAAPRALNTPNIVRNATKFSSSCVQLFSFTPSPTGESEDCLYLNVWTSPKSNDRSNQLKPVLVWIYGGGWNSGSASLPANDLTAWASAHPEIVFVSINYRLNFFGYPNTPAIMPPDTNAGLRDQRLAVEWVSKNIVAFGGDPTHIVLGGQSAGSASISGYLYAYPFNSLIKGAILMSGQAPLQITPPPGGAALPGVPSSGPNPFPRIAEAVGCPLPGSNSNVTTHNFGEYVTQLDCVRRRNTTELTNAITKLNIFGFSPIVDNQTVFTVPEYKSRGRAGKFARVALLTGTTDNEGDVFVLDRTNNTLNETLSDLFTLSLFRCFDSWQSSFSSSAGVSTYRYRYLPRFPTISPPPLRSYHTSDQTILFGGIPTEPEKSATVYLQRAWSAFILDPTNGLNSQLGWPLYTRYQGSTLVDIFKNNSVLEKPIQLENPTAFDSGCAALGLGL